MRSERGQSSQGGKHGTGKEDDQRQDRGSASAETADIAAQKQALRDVTEDARIEAASTPEELKALTLDVLLN